MATDDGNPTRLYTDDWMGYNNVSDIGFDHRKGNHSKGFGKATEHSNNIEAHWRVLRSVSGFNKGFYSKNLLRVEEKLYEAKWRIETPKHLLCDSLAQILLLYGSNLWEDLSLVIVLISLFKNFI